MQRSRDSNRCSSAVIVFLTLTTTASADSSKLPPPAATEVDFTKDVKPLLEARCGKCHGSKRQRGGLRLDVKAAALRGSDNGVVLVAGKSAESRLIHLVAGTDPDEVMPPKGERLSSDEVSVLRAWIDQGAKWPDDDKIVGLSTDHWALQPVTRPEPPEVNTEGWARSPIDRFVLARLEEKGLRPNPPAERTTLIRRLTFDLIGLPPTPDEIDAFVQDESPRAYEDLVDRLLASPHHGERWGRHWLDVARYTESQGFEYDRVRPNAWHYRDYVIASFNEDKPYDVFVKEQIAGDAIEPVTTAGIIATSLLVCGPYDQAGNSQQNRTQRMITREEELEDLVSVVTQTFLGMTVNCARCHAHKYDPIPQNDYYRIKAIFDGVKHGERDIGTAAEKKARNEKIATTNRRIGELEKVIRDIESNARELASKTRSRDERPAPEGPAPISRWTFDAGGAEDVVGSMHGTLHGGARIERGRLIVDGKNAYLDTTPLAREIREKTLEAWVALTSLDQGGGGVISLQKAGGAVFDAVVYAEQERRKWMAGSDGFRRTRSLDGPEETGSRDTIVHVANVYRSDGTIEVYRNGKPYGKPYRSGGLVTYGKGDGRILLGQRHTDGGRAFLAGEIDQAALYDRALSPAEVLTSFASRGSHVPLEDVLAAMSSDERSRRDESRARIDALRQETASLPAFGKSYAGQRVQPGPTHRLIKGSVRDRAEPVAPGALSVIAEPSGDLDLTMDAPEAARRVAFARWIADPRNPLTARVMVNRVWHYHFGRGIVASPSDFGALGEVPTHPLLLDWLATRFVERGWRVKDLHRLIVHSATYRQASSFQQRAARTDAGNRLLWRFPPRRLGAEAIRDAMLAICGRLNKRLGGPSFRPFKTSSYGSTFYEIIDRDTDDFNRRTVYRMNVNSGKDPLLDGFDCPDPSVKTPRRRTTTTPLQALSLMNSSFVNRQAKHLARRVQEETEDTAEAIELAYRYTFGRTPTPQETKDSVALSEKHGLETLCWALLNATEFLYVR